MSTSLPTRYARAVAASSAHCVVCGYPLRWRGARYCKRPECQRVKWQNAPRRAQRRAREHVTEPRG